MIPLDFYNTLVCSMKIRGGYLNKFVVIWRHEFEECKYKELKPLYMFVSGVGGTGKSFLIEMIRSQIKEIWKDRVDDDITCAVAAPTGLAAYIVECIAGSNYPLNMRERQLDTGHCLRLHKKQPPLLKLIIIDEVSMLSNLNLAYIHL